MELLSIQSPPLSSSHHFAPNNSFYCCFVLKCVCALCQYKTPRDGDTPRLNVIFIVIDSLSRANFIRTFPKTTTLLQSMSAGHRHRSYMMGHFNAIWANTGENQGPMFTGKPWKVNITRWHLYTISCMACACHPRVAHIVHHIAMNNGESGCCIYAPLIPNCCCITQLLM